MSNIATALYMGKGLPLLASKVRWVPMDGAPVASVVKSGSPRTGAWKLIFVSDGGIKVKAVPLIGGNPVGTAQETATNGGNSTTLIPGLTITYPATAVVGSAIIAVTQFGDPRVDQRWVATLETTSGTVLSVSDTITKGSDGIPANAKYAAFDFANWAREDAVANTTGFHMKLTLTHNSGIKFQSSKAVGEYFSPYPRAYI